jgi:hypothetical protein
MDEYNGWTNRETWAAHLWLTNEESLYHEATAFGATLNGTADDTRTREWFEGLINHLWKCVKDGTPLPFNAEAMLRDIGSVWRIDWRELAAALHEMAGA